MQDEGDLVTFAIAGTPSDAQWSEFINGVGAHMRTGAEHARKRVFIIDAYDMLTFPPSQRRILVDWRKAHHHLYVQCLHGVSYVVKSAAMRGLLRATFFVIRPPVPYLVAADRPMARKWAEEKLRQVQERKAAS
jgi:hypothetical protein